MKALVLLWLVTVTFSRVPECKNLLGVSSQNKMVRKERELFTQQ